jgi:uracil-DNA glycosylase
MPTKEDTHGELRQIVVQMKEHLKFQKELGIKTLLSRRTTEPVLSLDAIRQEIGDCTRCRLHEERNRLVFGEGDPHARLVFVGEAPGREEDLQGRPFVGQAGELLTRIIEAIDLTRAQVYITILRGQFYAYQGARLMPTYHPAFLLRNPQFKRDVWEDMKAIREEYKKA